MKSNRLILLIILFLTIASTGCAGNSSMMASGWAGLTSDEETAYISFNTQVVAVNLANGTERWHFPEKPDPKITFYAAPALTAEGDLIVGGYDNNLYRINSQNGQGKAFFEGAEGRFIGAPLVVSDLVYAPSADHTLYAVDLNGQQVWRFETQEPLWSQPVTDPDCNCIYLASMDHKVYALEAGTGRLLWSSPELGGAIVGTPTISDDKVVYVGTFGKELVALDASSGKEFWRFQASDWIWSGPAIEADRLYFGDISGNFYALDRKTGVVQWQIQPDGAIVSSPLITPEGIYFTTEDGSLVCVNPDGNIRWNQALDTSLHASPVAAGDTILIATSNPENLLIAVDLNGVRKWSFGLEK